VGFYYDWLGNEISSLEWAKLFSDNRHIGCDDVNGATVSTVYLGLDHGYDGPPLIFETMIFYPDGADQTFRYSTEAEARQRHKEIVEFLQTSKIGEIWHIQDAEDPGSGW
jgi:hypothetical protein